MKRIADRSKKYLAVICFFVFTVCLYGPFSLYFQNAEEFLMSCLLQADMRARESRAVHQAQVDKLRQANRMLQKQSDQTEDYRSKAAAQAMKIKTLRENIKLLKTSWSYRIGRAVTLIPRKIRSVVIGMRTTGGIAGQ